MSSGRDGVPWSCCRPSWRLWRCWRPCSSAPGWACPSGPPGTTPTWSGPPPSTPPSPSPWGCALPTPLPGWPAVSPDWWTRAVTSTWAPAWWRWPWPPSLLERPCSAGSPSACALWAWLRAPASTASSSPWPWRPMCPPSALSWCPPSLWR